MIDPTNPNSLPVLRNFIDEIKKQSKPLLLWIGAGTSKWAGLPTWDELAKKAHTQFSKYEPNYDKSEAQTILDKNEYPLFFQYLKLQNTKRYYEFLDLELSSTETVGSVYMRFINAILSIQNVGIITTNVDELLEKNLTNFLAIQNTDFSRAIELQQQNKSFILKLHGSVSQIGSIVMAADEYDLLVNNPSIQGHLTHLFSSSCILFLGTSLSDTYVLEKISKISKVFSFKELPHFALLPSDKSLPGDIKKIIYETKLREDHRASLQILEEISNIKTKTISTFDTMSSAGGDRSKLESAYLLAGILSEGTHSTSQILTLDNNAQVVVGNGFTDVDGKYTVNFSFHDILTGLLCFEKLYLPIEVIGHFIKLVGVNETLFLVQENIAEIIFSTQMEGIIFKDGNKLNPGDLMTLITSKNLDGTQMDANTILRRNLKQRSGSPQEFEKFIQTLTLHCRKVDLSDKAIPTISRSLLMLPSIRKQLGISEGTPANFFPYWHRFAVNRLAYLVRIGLTAEYLKIPSVQLNFGLPELAAPTFAAISGTDWQASTYASYILYGELEPRILISPGDFQKHFRAIMSFRNKTQANELRKQILEQILSNSAGNILATINGAMNNILDLRTVQKAKREYTAIYQSENTIIPVFNYSKQSSDLNQSLHLWKKQSLDSLKSILEENKIDAYADCPCGSGEKIKFCCLSALSTT